MCARLLQFTLPRRRLPVKDAVVAHFLLSPEFSKKVAYQPRDVNECAPAYAAWVWKTYPPTERMYVACQNRIEFNSTPWLVHVTWIVFF